MNAKQQREWEDDVTQPCAFPEPLAEVLTRDIAYLRAGRDQTPVEEFAWPTPGQLWSFLLAKPVDDRLEALERILHDSRTADDCFLRNHKGEIDHLQAIAADATTAAQNLRDELQGAQERLRVVEALHVKDAEFCSEDGFVWPCRTRWALDGEL